MNIVTEPIDVTQLTRHALVQRGLSDPVLHAALMYCERGDLTFEEALILAVLAYSRILEQKNQAEVERLMHEPARPLNL